MDSLRIGGAERALVTLLSHLDAARYKVTVLSISDGGFFSDLVKSKKGIDYRSLVSARLTFIDKIKSKLIYGWLSPKWVYRIFVPKNNDVEIAFCEGFTTKLIGASCNGNAKHIAWVHSDLEGNNWPLRNGVFDSLEEERSCYERFDTIVAVSDLVKDGLERILPNEDLRRIYNLVDADAIIAKSTENTNSASDPNCFNMISVGRLEQVKGYDRLIRAVARLKNDGFKDVSLTIVGGGTQYQALYDMIQEYELESIVTLTGSQSNPYSIMKGRDLYVCASRYEGYNLAIAEAMVLGLPVASTRCAGPIEILQDGKYGLLCDNNEEGIYQMIKEILLQPDLCEHYTQLSIERQHLFQKEVIMDQIGELL